MSPAAAVVDRERRFGGTARLYGAAALEHFASAHVCVAGIGGVGSWAAEALIRAGVGKITLVDLDHIAESNVNRQAHALQSTLGMAKVEAMRTRLLEINPQAQIIAVDTFIDAENAADHVAGCDILLDAVDDVAAKYALLTAAGDDVGKIVVSGGAGGKTLPWLLRCDDLACTTHDALLASLRRALRKKAGWHGKQFGVSAVYSVEPAQQPEQPGTGGLSCAGYGSCMNVTAAFGLGLASCALHRIAGR